MCDQSMLKACFWSWKAYVLCLTCFDVSQHLFQLSDTDVDSSLGFLLYNFMCFKFCFCCTVCSCSRQCADYTTLLLGFEWTCVDLIQKRANIKSTIKMTSCSTVILAAKSILLILHLLHPNFQLFLKESITSKLQLSSRVEHWNFTKKNF